VRLLVYFSLLVKHELCGLCICAVSSINVYVLVLIGIDVIA
jgi:uncharacterized membrane protein